MRAASLEAALTPRLRAVVSLVPRVSCCCDIGTDHGYGAIAIAKTTDRVIAADVRREPLKTAAENVRRFGAENVELRLSDGFSAISEGEAQCAVMAGMGGDLIKRIISAGIKGCRYLVLQPQSLIYELRGFLSESGFAVEDEALCREGGRFYVAMRVRSGGEKLDMPELQRRFGPVLLEKRPPLFEAYVKDEIRKLRLALGKINGGGKENAAEYERLLRLYGGVLSGKY